MKEVLKNWRDYRFTMLAFFIGACALSVATLAPRIQALYFGETLSVTASMLTITLLGLGGGYLYGVKLTKENPNKFFFSVMLLLSGLAVILIQAFVLRVLPHLIGKGAFISKPFGSGLMIMIPPMVAMGIIFAYILKYYRDTRPLVDPERLIGEIFLAATFGGAAGHWLTSFILIPLITVSTTLLIIGCILAMAGLFSMAATVGQKKSLATGMIALTALTFGLLTRVQASTADHETIEINRSGYYKNIIIAHDTGDYQSGNYLPVQTLRENRTDTQAQHLATDEPITPYVRFHDVYKHFPTNIKKALVIGGHAWLIPMALIDNLPEAVVDVVEIDPLIYETAVEYFNTYTDEPRLQNTIADGRQFLRESFQRYDYIFSDVYHLDELPAHMTTTEFFREAKDSLNQDGLFIAHFVGSTNDAKYAFLPSALRTFQFVFPNSTFLAVRDTEDELRQSFIAIGHKSKERINLRKTDMAPHILNTAALKISEHAILSDDYAPVDFMITEMMNKERKIRIKKEDEKKQLAELAGDGT